MQNILTPYNICFLGRTGNGKSSLINELFGTKLNTDPLVSCTKELHAVTIVTDEVVNHDSITIYDTPGIGEYSSIVKYQRYYEYAVNKSDCIVLVTTFDRTDAAAQRLLMQMKPFVNQEKDVRFVIALNHIDSRIVSDKEATYIPWDEELNEPSKKCLDFIEQRKEIINQRFVGKFLDFEIVPVCALRHYGIENLKNCLIK